MQNVFLCPNHDWGKDKEGSRSDLNVLFFLFCFPFFKGGSVGLLCVKVKQYLVLRNKKMKEHREKDVENNA